MSKRDNRENNAQRIKETIRNTQQNMEAAEEMIASTSDEKLKKELMEKNQRRAQVIPEMQQEAREEAWHQAHRTSE